MPKDSSIRKIKLSEGILVTIAVVARAKKRGPLVENVDHWPMVMRTGTNWQNWRLNQETGVVSDM